MTSEILLKPRKALNPAYLKVKPNRIDIEKFKFNLIALLDQSNDKESEEFHKNLVSDFLKKTWYDPNHFINTKGRNDLVIHNGAKSNTEVGVIIEAKKPTNKAEMPSKTNLNSKAFQELILYYLRERITEKNTSVRHLVVTNIYEWYIVDAIHFDRLFAQNKKLVKDFEEFSAGTKSDTRTDFFYKSIAEPELEKVKDSIPFAYFDFREYDKPLRNSDKADDSKLIALFKLLSPEHLLKLPFANDSNSLDKRFYSELLHLIGLDEKKDGGKKIIGRPKKEDRNPGSLLENAINQLKTMDLVSRLDRPSQYGDTEEERLFAVGLELCITWINRILFLKLLEAQLISYNKGNKDFGFLSSKKIGDFDELNSLFFGVLAKQLAERDEDLNDKFSHVPYLNSSLFEGTEMEYKTLFISNLKDDKILPIHSSTVLKDSSGKKLSGNLNTLEYIFRFLDAYDFSSEGSEEIQEENKTLINASVLGLIFEKINGYKDGSFFTPGFITMYMCKETIRRAVVQKFREAGYHKPSKGMEPLEGSELEFDDLYDFITDRNEANSLVNSLKICDPAVGSGHFLVSALNEIIAVKNDLRILQDRNGKRLKEYQVTVVNDELVITDEDGELFEYNPNNPESQRIQETLFHEKQTLIENCLFGVDINPNSVKICRLRLWIELLKSSYYKPQTLQGISTLGGFHGRELETLPNIDINIKCGNSLVSRFALDADLSQALKKSKFSIDAYRIAVDTYRNAQNKEQKREMERLIETIKSDFRTEITSTDPLYRKLADRRGDLMKLLNQENLFTLSKSEQEAYDHRATYLAGEIKKYEEKIEEIKNNKIYENAFEWRFEFPEVLNEQGDFVGFDVVIGNPPYIRQEELKGFKRLFQNQFKTYSGTADIYIFFIEKGFEVLKESGLFSYIMPNKFMQAGYGKPARGFLKSKQLVSIVDFGDIQVFEEATTYPCILIAKNDGTTKNFQTIKIPDFRFLENFEINVIQNMTSVSSDIITEDTWVISNSEDQKILDKIKSISRKLEDYLEGEANYGIKTGLSEAFFIDDLKREELITLDPKAKEIIKPMLRGREMDKWVTHSKGSWLIGTFPSLQLNIEDFPSVFNHLSSFGKERLEQSGKKGSRKKTSGKWFETQDAISYWKEFERPKIMYQVFQVKPCFLYDNEGLYCNNSIWVLPTDDKVLLGILNSKLGWWLISKYCTQIQNGYQLIWKYFSQIPIAIEKPKTRKEIEVRVNKIIETKKSNPEFDSSVLESEIDELVYELYEIEKEKINIFI
ncbi:class I SAM-dependent DNA methyltransferase [Algoriphagus mannitolivorans]|uniref:class I SAM-dependent DNA methyltransferase n=1 Tax=Algoriphagus mannitolivorans TaxID=226504 RepID=UPI000428A014|nr:Eco57I restriction-modification methylase domain-containing protein [Algoriphagus mannitolivorans]